MASWEPRPTLPRSWWSWLRPNRWASSMTITVALGISTPTSMIWVATRSWRSPRLKAAKIAFCSVEFIRPWSSPTRYPWKAWAYS